VPRGVPVVLRFSPLTPVGDLQVTSRAAGTVSLREVDVIWSPPLHPELNFDQSLQVSQSAITEAVFSQ
jgi:hypothetical protein